MIDTGCARRGVSGALNPKAALCGAESPSEGSTPGDSGISRPDAAQQPVMNLVRSGRKQR